MAITVGDLLAEPGLKLNLICSGGYGAMRRKIAWVHPTEVLDAAWSEPGEILLTCGMNFPLETLESADELLLLKKALKIFGLASRHVDMKEAYAEMWDCYISQLSQAGVLAYGFGLGIKHPSTPQALIDAAGKNGMVLFEIPLEIPFAAVSKTVSRSLENEKDSILRKTYVAQRRVIHALANPMPIRSVVADVASLVGGWAAFVDTSSHDEGEVIAISNKTFKKQAQEWALRLEHKREASHTPWQVKTLFGLENDRDYCVCTVQNPQSGREPDGEAPFGVIVASIPRPDESDMFLRSVTMSAADVLAVTLPRITVNDQHMRRLRSIAIAALAQGQSQFALSMAEELWASVPEPPLTLVCVDGERAAKDHYYSMLSTAEKNDTARKTSVFGEYGGRLWMIVTAANASILTDVLDSGRNLEYGIYGSLTWESLEEAFPEAIQDLHMRMVRKDGRSVADMSAHELVMPGLAAAYAVELFRPLRQAPAVEYETLLQTLRELVSCSFNVGVTAKRLAVHRHTVENRIGKLERLLGLNLAQESDRVKVYIACAFTRNGAMTAQ
jgi:hypothetical protein